ncbi:MAG TPA: hypothetical protein PKA27_13510 [Fimbriimonadaceae bacterium]|nr:hypothetical protein [Fimbriimonadaceae bacterium]
MKRALCIFLTVASTFALAQNQATFEGLLSGGGQFPATMKPADLPASYKACKIKMAGTGTAGGGIFDMMGSMMMGLVGAFSQMGSGEQRSDQPPAFVAYLDLSWTNGSILQVAGSDFLVTYALDLGMADLATLSESKGKPAFPDLKLILVKVSAINSFQPLPSVTKEAFIKALETPPPASNDNLKTQSLSNIKQVALATMMYVADYDDVFPWPQSSRGAIAVQYPYMKDLALGKSTNPDANEYYRFNTNVGGVAQTDIEDPQSVPLWYEGKPWPDGSRCVAFCDGHAKTVSAEEWPEVEKALNMRFKRTAKAPLPANHLIEQIPPR